jgi:heat shock protein HslJ
MIAHSRFALASLALLALGACQTPGANAPATPAPSANLAGTAWRLVEFQSMDDAQGTARPDDRAKYTLRFGADGRVAARLDCNRGMGPWQGAVTGADGGSLAIGPLATTKMLCPAPSMGDMLGVQLGYVRSYLIRDGRLAMSLMADGGIIVWERIPAR